MTSADDDRVPKPSDPAMLAQRRAKRAEMAEEQLLERLLAAQRDIDRLQGRSDALSGELELARERRDEMAGQIEALKRDLRVAHQREHAERQLRIETQDDLAQAHRDALGAGDELRAELRDTHQRAEEFERELQHRRRDADLAQGLIARHEVARARAEEAAHGADELRAELDRRDALQTAFAEQVEALREEIDALRERYATDAARHALAQSTLRDVMAAAARMRERLDQAQLLRAEAQERLALMREQLDERDEEHTRAKHELEQATVTVASLEAQLHSERERTAAALDAADGGLRHQLHDQALAYEAMLQSLRAQLQAGYEAQPGALAGPSPRETGLAATVERLGGELRGLRAQTAAQAAAQRELATLVGEAAALAADVRSGHEREAASFQAERSAHAEAQEEAALDAPPSSPPEEQTQPPLPVPPAAAESVIAGLSRAAQRLRSAVPAPVPEEDEAWEAFLGPRRPEEPITAWVTPALAALGATDTPAATDILVALLALQGRTGHTLLYELAIPGSGMWRVSIHHGIADIVRDARRAYDGSAAFHIAGGPQDVAVLAGGGSGRLGPGAKLTGKRRQARKLLRAGREPIGLADAALLIDPGQALALLAAAPAAAGVRDQQLAIELRATGADPARTTWHAVADAQGLRAGPGPVPPDGPAAQAILRGSPTDIVALLGGASSQGVSVSGDAAAARAMMDLLAAIQRV